VVVVDADGWAVTMLVLADVARVLTLPPDGSAAPTDPALAGPAPTGPALTDRVGPAQAAALRWLVLTLEGDGLGQAPQSAPIGRAGRHRKVVSPGE
jgi:hypothetical protein